MYEVVLDAGSQRFQFEDLNIAIAKFTESVATRCSEVVDLYNNQASMVRWVRRDGFYAGNKAVYLNFL